jgi:hypothetical protein
MIRRKPAPGLDPGLDPGVVTASPKTIMRLKKMWSVIALI